MSSYRELLDRGWEFLVFYRDGGEFTVQASYLKDNYKAFENRVFSGDFLSDLDGWLDRKLLEDDKRRNAVRRYLREEPELRG